MRVRLKYTSNPNMQEFMGQKGELSENDKGGYLFQMDNGLIINTSETEPHTTLGSVNYPESPSVSFRTLSGSTYDFENIERERLVDGCFREDNHYLGFEKEDFDREY